MAKNSPVQSKKHVAHLAQVRHQVTIIRYTAIAIVALVVLMVGYGILSQTLLLPLRTVATVNGERISAGEFQKRVGFTRVQLINQFGQYYQFYQLLGGDPNANPQLTQYLQQLQSQLDPSQKEILGQQVLDQLIDERIVAQEAQRLGITVSDEEIEERMQANFGFFPNGTPTAAPTVTPYATPTLNPTQLALVTITPTPSPFPTFTPEPTATRDPNATATPAASATSDVTATPIPTATPYTVEGYQTQVASVIQSYNENQVDIDQSFYRELVRAELLREKLRAEVIKDLQPVEEQAWVRHILVGSEQEALDVTTRLDQGEDFGELAKSLSIDTGSGLLGGDLGWAGRGVYVAEFEIAAFTQAIGEISQPIQSQFGWHIIQVLGREERPIGEERFNQIKDDTFADWVQTIRSGGTIDINNIWKDIVPVEPVLQ